MNVKQQRDLSTTSSTTTIGFWVLMDPQHHLHHRHRHQSLPLNLGKSFHLNYDYDSEKIFMFLMSNWPYWVSNRVVDTMHVIITPDMSMITCILVEEWAGSILNMCKRRGNRLPTTTEIITIANNDAVIAMVSLGVVW